MGRTASKKMTELEMVEAIIEFVSNHDGNMPSCGIDLKIPVLGKQVEVESIWKDDDGETYLHINHPLAEGDIILTSLPEKTIRQVYDTLESSETTVSATDTFEKVTDVLTEAAEIAKSIQNA